MPYKIIKISNNKIDKEHFKIGDILKCNISPQDLYYGSDDETKLWDCIICDFVTYNDSQKVPVIAILELSSEDAREFRLNEKEIRSYTKIGEIDNTHKLIVCSQYGYNDTINIKQYEEWVTKYKKDLIND